MLFKFAVIFLVVLCHIFSICIIGFCMPGLTVNEPPSFGSTIATIASTIVSIQYVLPSFHVTGLPPVVITLYKVFLLLLLSNIFFQIIWLPAITFFGIACLTLGKHLQTVPVMKEILDMNVVGLNFLEILLALMILYQALTIVGIVDHLMCMLKGGEKVRGNSRSRARRPRR